MDRYTLFIEPAATPLEKEIISDYWKISFNAKNLPEFSPHPNDLAMKYKLRIHELNKLVRKNSHCTIHHDPCTKCGELKDEIVYIRTDFKSKFQKKPENFVCTECIQLQKQKRIEELAQQDIDFKNRIKETLKTAVQKKRWLMLTNEEIEILRKMAILKEKSKIIRDIFNGNPSDKAMWATINKIERTHLLYIERGSNYSIIEFWFPENIENILPCDNTPSSITKEDKTHDVQKILNTLLLKNTSKSNNRQPDFLGLLEWEKPIKIDASVMYNYVGWITKEGNIIINIQTLDSVEQKVRHHEIEKQPEHIREALNKFIKILHDENRNLIDD